jgi:hypothetical protein
MEWEIDDHEAGRSTPAPTDPTLFSGKATIKPSVVNLGPATSTLPLIFQLTITNAM